MITTGGTIEAAVKGLLDAGCTPTVSVLATHAVFVGPAVERLQALPIQQLICTNSVESRELPAHFQVVNLAPPIAETIRRLHQDESLESIVIYR
jgi:ribose-phosphate pyrophosphokinase